MCTRSLLNCPRSDFGTTLDDRANSSLALPDGLVNRTLVGAVIFDLDGTLVQTEKLKARAYALAAQRLLGLPRPPRAAIDVYRRVAGGPRDVASRFIAEELNLEAPLRSSMGRLGAEQPWDVLTALQTEIYGRMIEDPVTVSANRWPHTISFLHLVRRCSCRTALTTMSTRNEAIAVLRALRLEGELDVIVTRDDVRRPKPDPEVYVAACRRLGLRPDECLAVEDSPDGVRAALAAGIETIAVATPTTRHALKVARLLPLWCIVPQPRQLLATVEACLTRRPGKSPGRGPLDTGPYAHGASRLQPNGGGRLTCATLQTMLSLQCPWGAYGYIPPSSRCSPPWQAIRCNGRHPGRGSWPTPRWASNST